MKRIQIEPELLSLFRLINGFWLVVYGTHLLYLLYQPDNPDKPILPLVFLGTLTAVVMLLYLYSGGLQRRMSRWYLPVGLSAASAGAMITQWFDMRWRIDHDMPLQGDGSERLVILLFVPLIIVSTQYNFRVVLVFTIVTAAMQGIIELPLAAIHGAPIDFIQNDISERLFLYPIMGFIIVRLVAGQKTAREALAVKNIKLTRYATTVERLVISHERNRLARELHDTLAHTLSAVAVQLEALNKQIERDPDNAQYTVKQLQDLTRSGLQEARRALQALRASPLEDLGLVLAMRQLVDSVTERSGMAISLVIPGELDGLLPEVEQGVYRITEEALNNAVRHARAQNVTVSLRRDQYNLQLTITDDGIGFDPKTTSPDGHYGLVGMRERALLCNGQLNLDSAPGTGTTLRLTVEE
jgi:signal transduction histidine kinase